MLNMVKHSYSTIHPTNSCPTFLPSESLQAALQAERSELLISLEAAESSQEALAEVV
jgi:hypothetical protein